MVREKESQEEAVAVKGPANDLADAWVDDQAGNQVKAGYMMDFQESHSKIYLSGNIRFLRKQKELSQEELAVHIGLNRGNIASYEKGTAEPKFCNLVPMADFFQTIFESWDSWVEVGSKLIN